MLILCFYLLKSHPDWESCILKHLCIKHTKVSNLLNLIMIFFFILLVLKL